ncbi:FAD:protein FMN transferase [Bacteroidia bacterium]|nr:FAD:protein FMN transferase [Bacteroidia bacterium]
MSGFLLAGCGQQAPMVALDGFTQGTTYHIALRSADTTGLQRQIDSLLEAVDNSMSIYNPASLLSQLNDNRTDSLDAMIMHCIEVAGEVARSSGGMYDITVMPLTRAWGFAAKEQQGEPNLDSLLRFVGFDKISVRNGRLHKTDPRVMLDLNSLAKGYTVDLVGGLIERRGVTDYLVEIGGEIVARGVNAHGKPWRIGIDRPEEGNFVPGQQLQTALALTNVALATSGNYRKFHTDAAGRKVVHIIDPHTGRAAAGDLLSATVIAPTCIVADAWGTALMALGLERSKEFLEHNHDIMACLIHDDGQGGMAVWRSGALDSAIIDVDKQ